MTEDRVPEPCTPPLRHPVGNDTPAVGRTATTIPAGPALQDADSGTLAGLEDAPARRRSHLADGAMPERGLPGATGIAGPRPQDPGNRTQGRKTGRRAVGRTGRTLCDGRPRPACRRRRATALEPGTPVSPYRRPHQRGTAGPPHSGRSGVPYGVDRGHDCLDGMAHTNDPAVIRRLLTTPGRWAIVGLSGNTARTAYRIARYLQDLGMEIVPVHPKAETVHGAPGYPTLVDVPGQIDVVDVFVRSELAGAVVDQAIAVGAKAVWLQLGVMDEAAAERAKQAGLDVVMDTCPAIEAPRLGIR